MDSSQTNFNETYVEPSTSQPTDSVQFKPPSSPSKPSDDSKTNDDSKTDTHDGDSTDTTTEGSGETCPQYPPCPPKPEPPKSTPVFVPVTVEVAPIVELLVNKPKFCLLNKAKTKPCFFFVKGDDGHITDDQ